MAKTIDRLNDRTVKTLKAGKHPDGKGLYLIVKKTGARSWSYRYMKDGREHWIGLGGYPDVSLAVAREKAQACREQRDRKIDPLEQKKADKINEKVRKAKSVTFRQCAEEFIELRESGWKNSKHKDQWRNTLETYAHPVIGDLPVSEVDITLVTKVLKPIWNTKTETASRVRQRIENVLDAAKVLKYRTGDNPARWKGNLDKIFHPRKKVQKVKHFEAMHFKEVPEFFRSLREQDSIKAKALAFTILTVTRSSESRGALWSEINIKEKTWTLPPERMKADRDHRVPLSDEAIRIIEEVRGYDQTRLFPGTKLDRPVSDATVRNMLQDLHPGLTVHGFRSSFKDWTLEFTSFPRIVVEMAMAHSIDDDTEDAYVRTDLLKKRAKLMQAWADFCLNGASAADVTPIKKSA